MYASQQHRSEKFAVLHARVLGIQVGTVAPSGNVAREGAITTSPPLGEGGAENEPNLGQALRDRCHEVAALVLLADDPEEAAAYVLAYLPHHVAGIFARDPEEAATYVLTYLPHPAACKKAGRLDR
jgi:hypothetical protein